jgi:hypothetical protein
MIGVALSEDVAAELSQLERGFSQFAAMPVGLLQPA